MGIDYLHMSGEGQSILGRGRVLTCEDSEVAGGTERRLMWLDHNHWGKVVKTKTRKKGWG